MTIHRFLQMVGDGFDWEKDWYWLVLALNHSNDSKFTGFVRNGKSYDVVGDFELVKKTGTSGFETNLIAWEEALFLPIIAGSVNGMIIN